MGIIEIVFPKLNHFWLDSGLLGLGLILEHLKTQDHLKIEFEIIESAIKLKGPEEDINETLNRAYDLLIRTHYDTSSKKQRDDKSSYNFYYDERLDKFIDFPKKKPVGIAELIYNKAPRPTGSSVKWQEKKEKEVWINNKLVKKTTWILPNGYSHLQKRLDEFLNQKGLKITTSGLLLNGPNEVRPNVTIPEKFKPEKKGVCFLCGRNSFVLENISQTVFPFITGESGLLNFNSHCGGPERVCWQCAYVAKFVPVNGFYLRQGDDLFVFFPFSTDLIKMKEVYPVLQEAKYDDPNLSKNFQHPLGFDNFPDGYFQKLYEVTFAFLYTIYKKILLKKISDDSSSYIEEICGLFLSKAPLEFVVVQAKKKGETLMGTTIWPFNDSVYFFRLMKKIEESGLDIKEVMRLLINFSQKNENRTLIRDRICERILKKRPILELIEIYVYSRDIDYIKPIFDLAYIYEEIIRKEGNNMDSEAQEAAVNLGKRIGLALAENGKKGDLFALRKTRRKTDFLSELNRLQFKYNLIVPANLYEGKLTDTNFIEFKQFCMIAALNSFLAAQKNLKKGENS